MIDTPGGPGRSTPPAAAAATPPPVPDAGSSAPGRPPRRRRRIVRRSLFVAGLALLAVDLARPPARQVTARGLLWGIHLYQGSLRDGARALGARCRFEPTCSRYAEAVILRDGALLGAARATWRILRCGPWTRPGTEDPP